MSRRTTWERVRKWFWDLVRGPSTTTQYQDLRSRRAVLSHERDYEIGLAVRHQAGLAHPWPTHKVSPERMRELMDETEILDSR